MFLVDTMLQNVYASIFVVFTIGYILKLVVRIRRKYKEDVAVAKDIACDKPHWLFGHLLTVGTSEESFHNYRGMLKKFPKCQPLWLGPFLMYIQGYYPDFLKDVLSLDEPKDEVGYGFMRPWIGDGLLTSYGKKWKRIRRLLTPAFHFDSLKHYMECTNEATAELLDIWSEKGKETNGLAKVEMFHDISRLTLDNLLRCILSKKSGCQRDDENEYLQAVKCLSEYIMRRFYNPIYHNDFIFKLTPLGRRFRKTLSVVHEHTENAIRERRTANNSPQIPKEKIDFLDMLLLAKDESGNGLSHQEICDEIDTFMFAGHDSVSSAISWAMYNLAVHPEHQEKCRNEVLNAIGKRHIIEWNDVAKFKYLTMFIKESMRLYPPVFNIGRTSSKPVYFSRGFGKDLFDCSDQPQPDARYNSSKLFPKNTKFSMNIMLMHYHPSIWENPTTFDPERFTPERMSKRSPYAYLPFSAGSRNCMGQHFAMNEIKVVLARTLSTFKILVDESYPKPEFEYRLVLHAKNGIHLKLQNL